MKKILIAFACAALVAVSVPAPAYAYAEEERTAGRSVDGGSIYPSWVFELPEHYPFLSSTSNSDPINDHPAQWQGQDWDPSAWNGRTWTPDIAIQKLFAGRIFERQYMDGPSLPVLVLGPTFFKLSDLDQRRCLKLMIDQTGIINEGYAMVDLRDWYTGKSVGSYTAKGMMLN